MHKLSLSGPIIESHNFFPDIGINLLDRSKCSMSVVQSLPEAPWRFKLLKFYCKSTVTPVLNGHSKIDKTKILMTNGSLMKVESIAECTHWSILRYF